MGNQDGLLRASQWYQGFVRFRQSRPGRAWPRLVVCPPPYWLVADRSEWL